MAEATCTAPDCDKPMHNRTNKLCSQHYQRLKRHGDVNVNKRIGPRPDSPINAIPESKKCSRCGLVKESTEFHRNIDRRTEPPRVRLKSACKSCCSGDAQAWRQRNPEKAKEIDKRYLRSFRTKRRRKARTYGLEEFELAAMDAAQQGHCLICKEFAEDGLVVDHDHATGHVRGLLCNLCNLGLGAFRDNPKRLLTAILYLKAGNRGVFD
ncbi:endonuclease domain-containing protein [Streptomyces sp. NPDC005407]|uniref:endonuclease domain-containing protein n=1 Tax=Streptomyces sp. NPDC005407 TaxID=3155340 RepID=UPI00339E8DA0